MTIKIASLLFTSIVFIDAILIVGEMSERAREREREIDCTSCNHYSIVFLL